MFASRISHFSASLSTARAAAAGSASGRHILKSIYAAERPEGMGAIVRRSLNSREMRNHDPFLLLDEFWVNSKGGFPDHPHRGFETVTYLLQGQLQHEDFAGHKGTIGPGDLQWMTAGRGIVHCEMPVLEEDTSSKGGEKESGSIIAHGIQLWVNLSHKDKNCDPQYQDLRDLTIPRAHPADGIEVKVISGEAHGVKSKVYTRTPTTYLDYKMEANKSVEIAVPKAYSGFVYVLSGEAYFGGDGAAVTGAQGQDRPEKDGSKNYVTVNEGPTKPFKGLPHHALILSQDDGTDTLQVQTKDTPAHFIVLTGQPLKEPIFQDRLFVLNSMKEVNETLEDFREHKNGFENAKDWRSTIGPKGYRFKF
ncbi:hypothetical protein BGZ98_005767 [Dissophora globulifera]|nr:hypothetical protein BGZ98_005767 [Dissophora globulifera]